MEDSQLCVWISGLLPPISQDEIIDIFKSELKVRKVIIPNYSHSAECCVVFATIDDARKALRYDACEIEGYKISVSRLTEDQYATATDFVETETKDEVNVKDLASTIARLSQSKLSELMALVGVSSGLSVEKPTSNTEGACSGQLLEMNKGCDDKEFVFPPPKPNPFGNTQSPKPAPFMNSPPPQADHTIDNHSPARNAFTRDQMHHRYGTLGPQEPIHVQHEIPFYQSSYYGSACRISQFSGDERKGDVSYKQWRHEVRSLMMERCPPYMLLPAIRKSVKGVAADALLNLGEGVSAGEILIKFDASFGSIQTSEALLEEFFSAKQQVGENISAWNCRLETILARAKQRGAEIGHSDQMLRSKFYRGLMDSRVKDSTRHHFDSGIPHVHLLQYARQIEDEISSSKTKGNIKSLAQGAEGLDSKVDTLMKLVESLGKRLDRMETQGGKDKKRLPVCYYCREEGHIQRHCPNRPGNGK